MKMRTLQSHNRPSPPLCLRRRMIVDRGSLNEASGDTIPVGELDRVVEPIDREPRQSAFELSKRYWIVRQDIEADEGSAACIPRPPRPNRKSSVGCRQAPDEFAQFRSHRRGRTLRGRHLTIHDDQASARQLACQICDQRAGRTMTDQNRFTAGVDEFQQMGVPGAPGGRGLVMGQHVRHLGTMSRFPQMSGCRLPARRADQRSCHKNEIQTHAPPAVRLAISSKRLPRITA